LNDPLQYELGWKRVPLTLLDLLASLFPALFVLLAILRDQLKIWTKIMICNALLAFGKGLFEVMTIIPDSIGWAECQVRLGENGVQWHSVPERSIWDLIVFEVKKYFGGLNVRYCADMMWSGHTYVVTLYALGLFELSRRLMKSWSKPKRTAALWIIASVAILQQGIEIYVILLNRFHYTMDVAMAILMTFLLYSNGAVAACAKNWVRTYELRRSGTFDKEAKILLSVKLQDLESDGEVIIPPCCLPFCCSHGQQHIYSDEDICSLVADRVDFENLSDHTFQRFCNLAGNDTDQAILKEAHDAHIYALLDNMAISDQLIQEHARELLAAPRPSHLRRLPQLWS